VLEWMERTRRRLGLIRDEYLSFSSEAPVRPILAIQRGADDGVLNAMRAVRSHLISRGVPEAERLEVCEVSLSGRMIPMR
jgi:hypothetical protein